jgi:hypothetical protein
MTFAQTDPFHAGVIRGDSRLWPIGCVCQQAVPVSYRLHHDITTPGQISAMSADETSKLVAYLTSPAQVPLRAPDRCVAGLSTVTPAGAFNRSSVGARFIGASSTTISPAGFATTKSD